MFVLNHPSSPLGYLLQFMKVERFGHMHDGDILDSNLIYAKFGIKNDKGSLIKLMVQGNIAFPFIKEKIEFSANLEKEILNMHKILTPEEFVNVLQSLKIDSPALKE
jgi:DNA-directed RNA polymerase